MSLLHWEAWSRRCHLPTAGTLNFFQLKACLSINRSKTRKDHQAWHQPSPNSSDFTTYRETGTNLITSSHRAAETSDTVHVTILQEGLCLCSYRLHCKNTSIFYILILHFALNGILIKFYLPQRHERARGINSLFNQLEASPS